MIGNPSNSDHVHKMKSLLNESNTYIMPEPLSGYQAAMHHISQYLTPAENNVKKNKKQKMDMFPTPLICTMR